MDKVYEDQAKVFRAFCDETRLRVLELLRSGEKCACILLAQVRVGQPTLSHHMKILTDSGVVAARRAGKWTYYSISAEGGAAAIGLLKRLTAVSEDPQNNDNNKRCCE